METVKQIWKDHRKVCIGAGVVIVILIIAALYEFMIHGLLERKHSCHVCAGKEGISL